MPCRHVICPYLCSSASLPAIRQSDCEHMYIYIYIYIYTFVIIDCVSCLFEEHGLIVLGLLRRATVAPILRWIRKANVCVYCLIYIFIILLFTTTIYFFATDLGPEGAGRRQAASYYYNPHNNCSLIYYY